MANTLTNIIDKILAASIPTLRETAVMPRLVNSDWSKEAAKPGKTIDVPLPTAMGTQDVTPSNTPPSATAVVPGTVQIPLENWKQNKPFALSDKEMVEIDKSAHFMPQVIGESVRAVVNLVNADILDEYKGVYGYTGTAGTTPFQSSVTAATQAKKVLNDQNCPTQNRRFVMDSSAEAEALALSQFADMEKTGMNGVKIEGEIGRKYGFNMFYDDAIPTHTAGTAAGSTTDASGYAIGVSTITLASAGTGTILVGDIFTIAGDAQTYVVTTGDADVSGGGTVVFAPELKVAITTSATAITLKASHTVNLAFHRDAFAFATRPLMENSVEEGVFMRQLTDPVTGITLRLERRREYKQYSWDFDILWGAKLVRPELACRIAG